MKSETPGQLLLKTLSDKGITRAEFGRLMGSDFQLANRWTRDEGFNEENRAKAAKALGLRPDYFDVPDRAQQLEEYRRQVFAEFVKTPFGSEAEPAELRFLDGIPFRETSILPTVAFYHLNLAALRSRVAPADLESAIRENEALDRSIAEKQAQDDLTKGPSKPGKGPGKGGK